MYCSKNSAHLAAILCYTNLMQATDNQNDSSKREVILNEVEQETTDRLSRIDAEFADGFEMMNHYNDTITLFGSARFDENHPAYQKAREVAAALSNEGYAIVTGGGGGIMEAGNRGAAEAGGHSIGLNIQLPHEQTLNGFATESMPFRYFFARKVALVINARAYVYFPGGFGTLDELFEVVTLMQTKKMPLAPIILVGNDFWSGLDEFIKAHLLEGAHTISPGDENIYTITEDIELIKSVVNQHRDEFSVFGKDQ